MHVYANILLNTSVIACSKCDFPIFVGSVVQNLFLYERQGVLDFGLQKYVLFF